MMVIEVTACEGEIEMSTPTTGDEPRRDPADPSDPYADLRHQQPEQPGYPAFPAQPAPAAYGGHTAHPAEYAPWGGPPQGGQPLSERPGTVIAAAVMVWVGAIVPVILGVLALFGGGIFTWFLASARFPDDTGIGSAAFTAIFVGIGLAILLWAALMVWAGVAAFRGRNWGRWVLAIQGGLYLLGIGGLRLLAFDPSVIIDLAYIGGCITLFFLPPSNRWYTHVRSQAA